MAQPSSIAQNLTQNLAPEIKISAPISPNPIIRQPEAAPIEEAQAALRTIESLKAPLSTPSNPVAEVQAKLRAALDATPKHSTFSDIAFRMLTALACAATLVAGLALGVGCVLLGAAIFLFPLTAGLSLAAVVVGSGYLGYRIYTGTTKSEAAQNSAAPQEMFEAFSAVRFSAAGVA